MNADAREKRARKMSRSAKIRRFHWKPVAVYSGPEQSTTLGESETVDGGEVLPGFALPLRDLFGELDRQGAPAG